MKGVTVVRLNYKADPEKSDPKWAESMKAGFPADKWAREMELDANAGLGLSIYGREYKPDKHERPLRAHPVAPMLHGTDFGHGWPAHVWLQRTAYNGVRVLASLFRQDMQLRPFLEQTIGFEINTLGGPYGNRRDYCDPAGNQPKDEGLKSVEVMREYGWAPKWRGSEYTERHEYLSNLLLREQEDGEPMFAIDPRYNVELCQAFRALYRRTKSGEPERIHPYIDLMNALEYVLVNTKSPARRRAPGPDLSMINPVSGYGDWGRASAQSERAGRLQIDPLGATATWQ